MINSTAVGLRICLPQQRNLRRPAVTCCSHRSWLALSVGIPTNRNTIIIQLKGLYLKAEYCDQLHSRRAAYLPSAAAESPTSCCHLHLWSYPGYADIPNPADGETDPAEGSSANTGGSLPLQYYMSVIKSQPGNF